MASTQALVAVARCAFALCVGSLAACYSAAEKSAPRELPRAAPRPRLSSDGAIASSRIVVRGPHEGALFGLAIATSASAARSQVAVGAPGFAGGRGAAYVWAAPFAEEESANDADMVFEGELEQGRVGDPLALGDLDGDGVAELALSAVEARDSAGRVYVAATDRTGAMSLADAASRIDGARSFDNLGLSVQIDAALAGRSGTLWIGVPHSGDEYSGSVLAFNGAPPSAAQPSSAAATLTSTRTNAHAGTAVAGGCDVDGDGEHDVLIGAWGDDLGETGGAAFLLSDPLAREQSIDDAVTIIHSREPGAGAGTRVLLADVNGDGLCDPIVTAPGALGQLGAIYGFIAPLGAVVDVEEASFTITGTQVGAGVGLAISTGDQDGDGLLDLFVGAPGSDEAGTDSGAVYLVYGPPRDTALDASVPRILGSERGDQLGAALAGGLDLDADGSHDLAVGAWGAFGRAGALVIVRNLDGD